MSIRRTVVAVCLVTVVALAGCASDNAGQGEGSDEASESSGNAEGAPGPGGDDQMQPPEADVDDVPEVVADVNGDEISRDEFVASYEGQLQQAAMAQQSTGEEIDQAELKQQVAELLVDNQLLTQAAEDAGIVATEQDIDATLEDLAEQNGLGSVDEVISALAEQGTSEEEARADAATQYQVTAYIDERADVEEPSEEELRGQYDALVEQMGEDGGPSGSEAETPPFEQVRDQLEDQAINEQQTAAVEEILADLQDDADVTINL